MMAKITKGGSFGGAARYVMDDKKSANLIDSNGVRTRDLETIIESFEMQAEMNPRVTKMVGHISLDFSEQDYKRLDDALMAKIAREYMMKMNILDTQYIVGLHHDKMHPHCHIIFNKIDNNGKAISDANERIRSAKICREITEKYGLHIASGKEKVKRHRLRGKDATKYKIYDSLVKNLPESKSWSELCRRLKHDGIEVNFKTKGTTSQIEGVRFTADNTTFNGSKIDRQFSYSKIDFALRHNAHMEQQATIQHHDSQRIDESNIGSAIGAIFDMPYTPDTDDELIPTPPKKKLKRKIRF